MTITADFSGGEKTVTTEPLYQWDTGQKLALSGLPATSTDIQVHFANAAMAQAIVKATELVGSLPTCDIPNEFLQFGSAAKARAWVFYKASNTEGYTVRAALIPITPRKRPNDYVSPEDPDSRGIVDSAIELLENYQSDLDSKLDDSDGSVKTANLDSGAVTEAKLAQAVKDIINAKEVKSNKKTTLTGNESSNDFYPTTKAVADALNTKADSSALTAKADVTYVDNRLNTKADVTYVDNRAEEVGDLKSALNYSQGYYNGVEIIKGGYIVTNGSTADPTEIVPNEAWCHSVLSASESDVFTISGSGGVNPRLWCFIDASNNVLSVSQSNYTDNFIEIVAPENANKLIFNTKNNVNYGIYRGKLVKREIADLQFHLADLQFHLSVQQKGTYIMPNTKIRQGTYFMGNFDNNDLTRICLEETSVNSGERIFVHPGNICTAFNILTFTEDSYATTGWLTNDYSVSINDTIRFSVVFRKTDPSENISPSEYDATVSITSYLQDQINSDTSKNIIVATYNEGAFEGDDYEQGSDALAIQYRRAVAELNANIVFVQDDVRYFNATEQSLPRNEVFAMFPNYYVNNGGSWNCIGWASDYSLHDLGYVSLENYHGHPRFYTAKVYVKGTTLYLLNVHLDWYDKELRQAQIREIISYITTNQLTHVIIAGDMNPSVRENGQFPSGTSHTHNYSNSDEDYAIWTSAGFKVCNGGYFGDYMTDITYSDADDGGAKAAWDNIIVSNDIDIKRVGTIIKPYMNDHVPFFAELVIK